MLINFQNQSDSKNLKFLFDGIFFLIPETEIIFIYSNLSLTIFFLNLVSRKNKIKFSGDLQFYSSPFLWKNIQDSDIPLMPAEAILGHRTPHNKIL